MTGPDNVFDRLRAVVCQVPAGHVATYGQISKQVLGTTPRMVGFALAGLGEGSDVPWHRIVNAAGRISLPADGEGHREQARRLASEGIDVSDGRAIDLEAHGWFS